MATRAELMYQPIPMATEPPHGVKRPATEPLESDQRLAKRFNLLNIDSHGKLYIPVAVSSSSADSAPPPDPSSGTTAGPVDDDWMQLEDTKDKVYIYDLDKELAELESDDEHPIFLPDIEKHLTKIPHHVLVSSGTELERTADNQLVLYGVPNSLSVPEDKDSVRKAIIEARQRAGTNPASQKQDDGTAKFNLHRTTSRETTGASVDATMAADADAAFDEMDVEPMEVE